MSLLIPTDCHACKKRLVKEENDPRKYEGPTKKIKVEFDDKLVSVKTEPEERPNDQVTKADAASCGRLPISLDFNNNEICSSSNSEKGLMNTLTSNISSDLSSGSSSGYGSNDHSEKAENYKKHQYTHNNNFNGNGHQNRNFNGNGHQNRNFNGNGHQNRHSNWNGYQNRNFNSNRYRNRTVDWYQHDTRNYYWNGYKSQNNYWNGHQSRNYYWNKNKNYNYNQKGYYNYNYHQNRNDNKYTNTRRNKYHPYKRRNTVKNNLSNLEHQVGSVAHSTQTNQKEKVIKKSVLSTQQIKSNESSDALLLQNKSINVDKADLARIKMNLSSMKIKLSRSAIQKTLDKNNIVVNSRVPLSAAVKINRSNLGMNCPPEDDQADFVKAICPSCRFGNENAASKYSDTSDIMIVFDTKNKEQILDDIQDPVNLNVTALTPGNCTDLSLISMDISSIAPGTPVLQMRRAPHLGKLETVYEDAKEASPKSTGILSSVPKLVRKFLKESDSLFTKPVCSTPVRGTLGSIPRKRMNMQPFKKM